jgi:uncharacterized integral membrane protein
MANGRQMTTLILVATVVFLAAWSAFAAYRWGEAASVSAIVTHYAKRWPALAFGLGFVAGHWLWR